MALAQDLLAWANSRPWWQQQALGRLAAGDLFDASDYKGIATALLVDPPMTPEGGWLGSTLEPAPSNGEQVRLLAVGNLTNVNALVPDQRLTFGLTGMTVVYGDNGSGKSGYARLIKRVVGARHREDILSNVFAHTEGAPEAVVAYSLGEAAHEDRWNGTATGPLARVFFYDERCGDSYVSVAAEVSYRPSALRLLDSLIGICDGVRSTLDELIQMNSNAAKPLPAVAEDTPSGIFLRSLNANTTDQALDEACAVPEHAAAELQRLIGEEARLRVSDPTTEKERLLRTAASIEAVVVELTKLTAVLGADAETSLRALGSTAREKRAAANVASSVSFDEEPVPGVGTETWRALWEASLRFSKVEAFPALPFPVTGGEARCLLCQQPLLDEASLRLHRFHTFMTDDTQSQAETAERRWQQALIVVRGTQTLTPTMAVHLEALAEGSAPLVEEVRAALTRSEQRRVALSSLGDAAPTEPEGAASRDLEIALTARATATRQKAQTIDATQVTTMIADVDSARRMLEARQTLAAGREAVAQELTRKRERARLDEARRPTDTTGITRKSTELTRSYVTTSVQDRFSRESDRLGVERVTLQDTGGRKGQLLHQPAFLAVDTRADLPRVLSEGEQTALGLAGFFTEVYFDETNSALVLDDPVTSLDHLRRVKVAVRLAELSRDRQVIVFTHDVTFAGDLRKASEQAEVTYTERSVERRRKDDAPGVCLDIHPWSVKDAKARLGALKTDLARIRREQRDWDRTTYEKETGLWAGDLSETWERIISMEIANMVVDRGTLEVHVRMVKMLARITDADNKELQQSYSRCSQWAKRHDKDGARNSAAPTESELEDELALVKSWFERVKKYKVN